MFAIQLIYGSGGSNSVRGETVEECKKNAAARARKDHIVATVPYEVFLAKGYVNAYDTSIPEDIRQSLGEEVMKLYSQHD